MGLCVEKQSDHQFGAFYLFSVPSSSFLVCLRCGPESVGIPFAKARSLSSIQTQWSLSCCSPVVLFVCCVCSAVHSLHCRNLDSTLHSGISTCRFCLASLLLLLFSPAFVAVYVPYSAISSISEATRVVLAVSGLIRCCPSFTTLVLGNCAIACISFCVSVQFSNPHLRIKSGVCPVVHGVVCGKAVGSSIRCPSICSLCCRPVSCLSALSSRISSVN
jgi:hypothetical protein